MTKLNEIYKCSVCGNIVEVVHTGAGELVCCGKPMILMEEKNKDEGLEKHVPVVETGRDNVKVKVGSVPHPMEENHYIEWIEVLQNGEVAARKRLSHEDEPAAEFCLKHSDEITVRAYCNVHGLWES